MYVVFEGIDGSGKTTQIKRVEKELSKRINEKKFQRKVISIAETELQSQGCALPNTNLVLRYALQRINLQPVIRQNKNNIVLSDRSYLSSLAYQGLHGTAYVKEVNSFAIPPDLVIFLTTEPESAYLENVQSKYSTIFNGWEIDNISDDNVLEIYTPSSDVKVTTNRIVNRIWSMWMKKVNPSTRYER